MNKTRTRDGTRRCRPQSGFTLLELLIVVAVLGVLSTIVIPNLLEAMDRGRQRRTMADIRSVAASLEAYSVDSSIYPSMPSEGVIDGSIMLAVLEPAYVQVVPRRDGWDHDLRYASDMTTYTVGALGRNGASGGSLALSGSGGPTHNYDCDIIYSQGSFIQWPEGLQND